MVKIRKRRKPKPKPAGWDLWKDGVTYSFIASYLACREQTRLAFCEMLRKKEDAYPLSYGSCIHWCLAEMAKLSKKPNRKKVLEYIQAYRKRFVDGTMTSTTAQQNWERVEAIAEILLPGYVDYWSGDWTGKYRSDPTVEFVRPVKWIDLEESFKVPYEYPDGKVAWLRGKRDGIFWSESKRIWLFETKVKSQINYDMIREMLPWDFQVLFYMYTSNLPICGVVYNLVRWPGFRSQDIAQVQDKVRDDIEARPSYYFTRINTEIGKDEIATFKTTVLDPIMQEIRAWTEGKAPHFMNPMALTNRYGRSRFYEWIVYGNTNLYEQRETVFQEIEEDL